MPDSVLDRAALVQSVCVMNWKTGARGFLIVLAVASRQSFVGLAIVATGIVRLPAQRSLVQNQSNEQGFAINRARTGKQVIVVDRSDSGNVIRANGAIPNESTFGMARYAQPTGKMLTRNDKAIAHLPAAVQACARICLCQRSRSTLPNKRRISPRPIAYPF